MFEHSQGYPSSAASIGSVEDMISREDLLAAYAAADLVDRARQINSRVSPPEAYSDYTGFVLVDVGRAVSNALLLGMNSVRVARAERYIDRAERQLGMPLPTSVYKNS